MSNLNRSLPHQAFNIPDTFIEDGVIYVMTDHANNHLRAHFADLGYHVEIFKASIDDGYNVYLPHNMSSANSIEDLYMTGGASCNAVHSYTVSYKFLKNLGSEQIRKYG